MEFFFGIEQGERGDSIFKLRLKNVDKLKKGSELSQLTDVTHGNIQMCCVASNIDYGGHMTFASSDIKNEPNMLGSWTNSEMKQNSN